MILCNFILEMEQKHEENGFITIVDLYKESLVKVCSESTSHGLPNNFRTKNWIIRSFWLVLFLCGSGAALYCKKTRRNKMFG